MARAPILANPLLLGFEEVERAVERVARSAGDGYPPFNIERLAQTAERGEVLRITLAVAGFRREDLDVTVEENQLVIRGRQGDEGPARTYLHRGIAARQFQKSFLLADGIEVLGADLCDGLLSVDIARPAAARIVRKVKINGLAS